MRLIDAQVTACQVARRVGDQNLWSQNNPSMPTQAEPQPNEHTCGLSSLNADNKEKMFKNVEREYLYALARKDVLLPM